MIEFTPKGVKIARGYTACLFILYAIFFLTGCATSPQTYQLISQSESRNRSAVYLNKVPFFPQEKYQCGPAALATVLVDAGIGTLPKDLVDMVYVPDRKGSLQVEMKAAARRHGRIPYTVNPELTNLLAELDQDRPVLVLQNLGLSWIPRWHYAVIVGYDTEDEVFYLRSGELERRITKMSVFENTWRRSNYWGFVLLTPGEIPAVADEQKYFIAVADFLRLGDQKAILEALLAGVKRWPHSKNLNMAIANQYQETGRLRQAAEVYTQLVEIYPEYAPAHNNLALALNEIGDINTALEHALKATGIGGRFESEYRKTVEKIKKTQ